MSAASLWPQVFDRISIQSSFMSRYKQVSVHEDEEVAGVDVRESVIESLERLASVERDGDTAIRAELMRFRGILVDCQNEVNGVFMESHIQYLISLFHIVEKETALTLYEVINVISSTGRDATDLLIENGILDVVHEHIRSGYIEDSAAKDMFVLLAKLWERQFERGLGESFPLDLYMGSQYRNRALILLIIIAGHNPPDDVVHSLCLELLNGFVAEQSVVNKYAWIFMNLAGSNIENLRFILDMPELAQEHDIRENLYWKVHEFFRVDSPPEFLKPYLQFLCLSVGKLGLCDFLEYILDSVNPHMVLEIALSAKLEIVELMALKLLVNVAEKRGCAEMTAEDVSLILSLVTKHCFVKSLKYLVQLIFKAFQGLSVDLCMPLLTPSVIQLLCDLLDGQMNPDVMKPVLLTLSVIVEKLPFMPSARTWVAQELETRDCLECIAQYMATCPDSDLPLCRSVSEQIASLSAE